ncbi:alkaline phosphatase D family protein [Roseibacillus ishigakijimensis]|uniref:Alkaline phosphatase family protein n=1 Tax=Roseibacillus ishigakijimensis TaxID=454146 RepID=A0A934RT49_9BACT|nr:alkaline phosphatase D family protein [Roseibacillus ishigakijimensis]MBK1835452.1 alkaline phosphatase family protein [Roseibacillus ishigakijimensis]
MSRLVAFLSCTLSFATAAPLEHLVFASCHKEGREAPALEAIVASKPDLFIWMGDNIYGDSRDVTVLEEKYARVLAKPPYQTLQATCPIIGTWDDHDYGANDAGKDYPVKEESQRAFLDFLGVPRDSPRREREGVYAVHDYGEGEQQVRVILLDTRYHRDSLDNPAGTILGQEQWQWLEKQLAESKAAVNILVSSIQVLPAQHRFEKWANFPKDRDRLLGLLAREEMPPVVILSGDRHLAEISRDLAVGYPLYDITSSSLNSSFGGNTEEENQLRVGENFGANNYGSLTIDWHRQPPVLTATIHDQKGRPQRATTFQLQR